MTPPILCLRKKRLSFVLIRIKSIVPVREDNNHLLNRMKGAGDVPFGAKVMGNNRPGNLLRGIIPFGKTSTLRKLLKSFLQGLLQIPICPILRIRHRISNESNIFMEKPVVLLFLHFPEEVFCLLGIADFPPKSLSMKVIPVKKKKDWISGGGALIKIIRQDDEEAFLLP
jgi:hypothetical protein